MVAIKILPTIGFMFEHHIKGPFKLYRNKRPNSEYIAFIRYISIVRAGFMNHWKYYQKVFCVILDVSNHIEDMVAVQMLP